MLLRSVLAAGGMPILGRAEDGRVEKDMSGAQCCATWMPAVRWAYVTCWGFGD